MGNGPIPGVFFYTGMFRLAEWSKGWMLKVLGINFYIWKFSISRIWNTTDIEVWKWERASLQFLTQSQKKWGMGSV